MATRGRPREFDVDSALDRAVDVFWTHGYEGTTLDDLTDAMGISKPSLYAAFGNKERTFEKVLERYTAVDMAYVRDAIAMPTAREVAEHYLHANVEAITLPGRPAGCLSIQGGLSGSAEDSRAVEMLKKSRGRGEQALADRMQTAIDAGDLAQSEDPKELARYLATVSSGLAVQAAAGASRADLRRVADRALTAFP